MTKQDMQKIAELVHERMVYDACPECGAISMLCAKVRGLFTVCGVTDRPIKPSDESWNSWLKQNRGTPSWVSV